MFSAWPDAVVAAAAAPLLVAGAAKMLTPEDSTNWPTGRWWPPAPFGPRLAGGAELGAAATAVALPGRPAALLALAVYACLTVVAYTLRGQTCACFGGAARSTVGPLHLACTSAGAAASLAALAAGPGTTQGGLRAVVCVAASAVTLAVLLVADQRGLVLGGPLGRPGGGLLTGQSDDAATDPTERVHEVLLYTSVACPSCKSLHQILDAMEPARRQAVTTTVLGEDEQLPDFLDGLGLPAAFGLNATGEAVYAPVSGIGAVKALIESVTIGAPAGSTETPVGDAVHKR
ncbi:hypothetical protein J7E96_15380 [Streptomyces sp. ISL-96]|uniref:hypothetical protein n=1 Tax=Streptomyces sp. ISL-96 TaxID=2819191 RepID=UPI001BEAE379|nr:hypothetical protein [Streptomyces sp. ISL-96]MBT2489870.1 hypothetical protein [Streptomyces sp. ISL-96]